MRTYGKEAVRSMRVACLGVWCLFLFGYGLSGPLYRTEALRAIIAQEALEGHWLVPTLYDEPFLTKPPGIYVAIAAVSSPWGEVTERTARIPSALAASLFVFFVYGTLRSCLTPRTAFLIAFLLPVSFLWLEKAPSAEIDMLQLAWVGIALLSVYRAELATGRSRWGWWLLALGGVAGGLLTKWTAPAFFYLTVVPWLWSRGRLRVLWSGPHLVGCGLACLLCAAWVGAVVQAVGWDVLRDTVGREAAQRFAPKGNGKPYPWLESLTFPFVLLAANAPWSLLVLARLRKPVGHTPAVHSLVQLLHCWLWPNILFWSLPAQHNVRYVLPIVPAFVMLGTLHLQQWYNGLTSMHARRGKQAFALAFVAWMAVKVGYVEWVVPTRTAHRHAEATGKELARLVPDDQPLYVKLLKDEGIMFYYGRPARRLNRDIPVEPFYVLLIAREYEQRATLGTTELVAECRDQQQAPIYLVRVVRPLCQAAPMAAKPLALAP